MRSRLVQLNRAILACAGLILVVFAEPAIATTRDLARPSEAGLVAQQLRAIIPTISGVMDVSPRDDPNQVFGQPGSYISKARFVDTTNDLLGYVEVFRSREDADIALLRLSTADDAQSNEQHLYISFGRMVVVLQGGMIDQNQFDVYQSAMASVALL